jgi:hypothetical protein
MLTDTEMQFIQTLIDQVEKETGHGQIIIEVTNGHPRKVYKQNSYIIPDPKTLARAETRRLLE